MDERRDLPSAGRLPVTSVYQPSPLPDEFLRENEDLRIPRKGAELDGREKMENLMLFRPFF